ncbi:MAG TPA: hypothetical protein VK166_02170 [Chitinophagaceae bacterium]|nr:hypothetical protein [Chitinophagaceae bacterium]
MRPILVITILVLLAASCKNADRTPDVSGIKINLEVQRFEQDLFAMDTANMAASIQAMQQKYPQFLVDFMANILGVPAGDPQAGLILKKFITDFRTLKETADKKISNFTPYAKEVEQMLKYVKHYFPQYQQPAKLITFIGPMDAFYEASLGWSGDIITTSGLGVGLQMHLGGSSSFYMQDGGQGYPEYISRRFEPEYIAVNCAKNIIDDIYPDQSRSKALVDQMVDKGKRLYILDRLLPKTADTLKIGYTKAQLEGCYKNEGLIWNTFATNNLLFETDYQKLKTFVGEGPKTMELGENSPGYIALFVGKQIVEAYMEKFPETSLQQLLSIDNRKIYELSKYKPK